MFLLIDEASFQHPNGAPIDFTALAHAGVSGVYIKATESTTYTNPYCAGDVAAARKAGRHVGLYHFFHPGVDPLAQARYFLGAIAKLDYDLRPAMDFEVSDNLPPATAGARAAAFEATLAHDLRYSPLCYTYPSFDQQGFCGPLGRYPLWLANVSNSPIPAPWTNAVLIQGAAQAESGVQGGPVDVDTTASLTALLVPTSHPQEEGMLYLRNPANGGEYAVTLDPAKADSNGPIWVARHLDADEAGVIAAQGHAFTNCTPAQVTKFNLH